MGAGMMGGAPPGMGSMPGMGGMGGMPGMPGMGGLGGMPGFPPMGGMLGMNPMMMNMMQGNSAFSGTHLDDPTKPPKERWAKKIADIKLLGFDDEETIIKALTETEGDPALAMDWLFQHYQDYDNEEDEIPDPSPK